MASLGGKNHVLFLDLVGNFLRDRCELRRVLFELLFSLSVVSVVARVLLLVIVELIRGLPPRVSSPRPLCLQGHERSLNISLPSSLLVLVGIGIGLPDNIDKVLILLGVGAGVIFHQNFLRFLH